MRNWNNILIAPTTSILQTIKIIDMEGLRAALVVDDHKRLLGIVTDGDIRRCLLRNISLETPIQQIMNSNPVFCSQGDNRENILFKLQSLRLHHVPLLDEQLRVVGFETLEDLLSIAARSNLVIVMAGGMGKRLHPLTVDCPKPLLKIGNKPVLEILLENFIKCGFKDFYFAVNYKSQMIKDYFRQGEQWGATIRYLEENKRLGTAGALSLLPEVPKEAFFVINADVVTNIDFQCLLEYHHQAQVDATLCIREHEQTVPYGVVQRDETTHHLLTIVEKPVQQFFVNAGIYVLEPRILTLLAPNQFNDMPDLLISSINQGHQVTTFPLREYWLDIGRHEDLARAHLEFDRYSHA